VFFYYIGHGIVDKLTHAVLNAESLSTFPVERALRSLGEKKNVYVLAVLDCSRVTSPEQIEMENPEPTAETNCIITFGCAANSKDFRSTLAVDYVNKLVSMADPLSGAIVLPNNAFYRWRSPGKNGEHFIQTTRDLLLISQKSQVKEPTF